MKKIVSLDQLTGFGGVLCHGCFDILHIGHIRQLVYARGLAPRSVPLIVTLTHDRFISKGAGRPCFSASLRAECVAAVDGVDYVAVVHEATGLQAIEIIRPAFYVKGREYEGRSGVTAMERELVERYGGTAVYTDVVYSTTKIVEYIHAQRTCL